MRYLTRASGIWWAAAAVLLALALVPAGCGASNSGQRAAHTQATATATAAATSTPAYATPLATAVPSTGWAIYHDAHYPFQMPIPPGWQVGTVSSPQMSADGCSYYEVGVFPPGVKPILDWPLLEVNYELIDVMVETACSPDDPAQQPGSWQPERMPLTISGVSTIVYDHIPAVEFKNSWAAASFGGHEYNLMVQSPPSTAAYDVSVFRTILGGFQYTGK